ncbi:probable methylthioribulose-1-phosphate dehydratase isoform X2 [Homarus americanus]|uniref:probable methylthioribulose-1-phosphate dehydratase isoform X2 n=1 Tax=Homarus americanus TaxID=6706 RepID=UPI001C4667C3|nr:probable methylthioribulose-1-phosphate dehydratase isoform X2 [Homarus americanus]
MSEEDNSEVSRYKEDEEEEEEEVITPKRRRGRPRKRSANTEETGSEAPDTDSTPLRRTWVAKKPLGRPKLSYYESSRRSKKSPSELICELGQVFYNLGWVSGTGGGISIKDGDHIYVAPSGVQKERLKPEDMFVLNMDGEELDSPHPERNLKKSQCTPLFMLAYKIRGAGAVIHSHSKAAVLATLAFPGSEFKVTQLEMIKGIKNASEDRQLRYDEELVVPIIENTPYEADLADTMSQALEHYPDTNAVLVRRHGVYVWGDTWEKAKTMAESYDYLFDVAVQMTKFGLDPSKPAEEVKMAQVNGK